MHFSKGAGPLPEPPGLATMAPSDLQKSFAKII
jgi:hypothetical protein